MKYYAVIDTNVLVSAMLKWNSVPGNVMELVFDGPIIPVYNSEILKEYREVLSRPKFHLTEEIVDDVLENIENRGINVEAETLDIILPDPKDRVFYEVVLEERKTEDAYLVTGNIKHFLAEPFVVTPRKMLDIVFSEAEVE
jgi:putative PIN family toxin of toxin-antitoxin system